MNEHLHPMFKGILNTTYEAMRLPKQPPMGQFVVCAGYLCEYTDRWDFWWGFLRVIKPLKETK